ncbi:MAG: hypothetical protein R2911_39000 [Caldilineaceae bacterium]
MTPSDGPTATSTPIITPTSTQPAGSPTVTRTPNPVCSVSIGDGQLYTNQRDITIHANVTGAVEMQLSNDNNFNAAIWRPYAPTQSWTLSSPSQTLLTLQVFARFRDAQGNQLCNGAVMIDDILYDAQPPTLRIVSFTSNVVSASNQAAAAAINGTLTIEATDQQGGSGVLQMRIGALPDLADVGWRPFVSPATVALSQNGQMIYAQVQDGAGNVSHIAGWALDGNGKTYLPIVKR